MGGFKKFEGIGFLGGDFDHGRLGVTVSLKLLISLNASTERIH